MAEVLPQQTPPPLAWGNAQETPAVGPEDTFATPLGLPARPCIHLSVGRCAYLSVRLSISPSVRPRAGRAFSPPAEGN